MKKDWMICAGFLLLSGCSAVGGNPSAGAPDLVWAPALDGFWCDLAGVPANFILARRPLSELPAYPRDCLPGNHQVPTAKLCRALDAPCYQLDTGSWCSGDGDYQSPRPYF